MPYLQGPKITFKCAFFSSSCLLHRLCPGHTESSFFFSESNKFKAAIIRIDSPGGDALASDL